MGRPNREPRILRIARVMWHRKRFVVWAALLGVLAFGVVTFQLLEPEPGPPPPEARPWAEIVRSGTLRAVTVSASTSAFRYRGKWRGHGYEEGRRVASELGLRLAVSFAPSEQAMLDSLHEGRADVALWPVAHAVAATYLGGPAAPADAWQAQAEDALSAALKTTPLGWLRPCGPRYVQHQVLVRGRGARPADGDTVRRRLAVIASSRQQQVAADDTAAAVRLLLEPYDVVVLPADSLTPERLAARVAEGQWDATLCDRSLARLLRSYHTGLILSDTLALSGDTVSWMVSALSDTLAQRIDSACRTARRTAPEYAAITKQYYEQSLGYRVPIRYLLGDGRLSVYDDCFRHYAAVCGWDWRKVAAVAFVESRFDPHAESARGARGLMQLMPATAVRYGCPEELMSDPEASVAAGVNLLADLQRTLRDKIVRLKRPDVEGGYAAADTTLRQAVDRELDHYVIAAYNSGLGHVYDALMLADTLGYDVARWTASVETCLELKDDSAYYNHPVVRLGRFNGAITTDYVRQVLDAYAQFCMLVPSK